MLDEYLNDIHVGHAAHVLAHLPDHSIDLIITSPPYWTAVTYADQVTWESYDAYLADLLSVWQQCARVLRPNGKLCINTAAIAIPKAVIAQHTRHLKNIPFDVGAQILATTDLLLYSMFVWQKQKSGLIFGSYPYPGNLLETNTVEFINVYVKPGKPPRFAPDVKAANKLTTSEWLDLTQQVWFMYPQDVKRAAGHPAPFPKKLPARLIRLYSYGAAAGFAGEIVLDPFAGTGTTCAVAQAMGRRWIGVDVSERYCAVARQRLLFAEPSPALLVGHGKYPSQADLLDEAASSNRGKEAASKHKRKIYGREAITV